jgi:hypothetical protein
MRIRELEDRLMGACEVRGNDHRLPADQHQLPQDHVEQQRRGGEHADIDSRFGATDGQGSAEVSGEHGISLFRCRRA